MPPPPHLLQTPPNPTLCRQDDNKGLTAVLKNIVKTMFHLPTRIGAVCKIWFFAWIGWFPFLLYSTTFVGEVLQRYDLALREQVNSSTDKLGDIARIGSVALVIYSVISLLGSISIPWLVQSPESEDLRKGRADNKSGVMYSILEFLELYRPDLVSAWFGSHVMFAVAMFLTLFVRSVWFATVIVGACGVPWALMTWAPFAIIGEEINRLSDSPRHRYGRVSTDTQGEEEAHPMMDIPRHSMSGMERPSVPALHDIEATPRPNNGNSSGGEEGGNELSGIYLGILNVFACLPQFVSTFISFVVFSILEPGKSQEFADDGGGELEIEEGGVNAIAVVMGLGGISVLVAAHYTMRFKNL